VVEGDSYGDYILRTGREIESWEEVFNGYLYESRFKEMERVVDLGPGRCAFTHQSPQRIIAIDSSPAVVEQYSHEGLDIRLGSAYEIPLADSSVDGLFSCWLLEHLEEPDRCVRETYRILRPGGYACFVVPSAESLRRGFYDDFTHIRPFTPASCHQLAEAGGFDRHSASYLFWTRGLRHFIPSIGMGRVAALIRQLDLYGRRIGLVNRYNLLFEVWKTSA
jgi:SAM-dependent methyltransferase